MKMMKKLLLLLLICSGFNYSNGQNIRPGEFILWFHSEKAAEEFFASSHGIGGTGIFFSKENKLAPSFPLWLCNANTTLPDETVLRYLRGTTAIRFAQHNHLLSERSTTPNDPDFTQQWDKHNTGQNGGTPDADIDAPEAWDITTGGLTSLGDTIVVAVIDGGFDLAHEDISFFKNYQEIPGNGQDDDNNGYTDDFDGWDAYTHDGDPNDPGGDHGTHVCGIIGAKGNNNTGIAGVNWNVKVMPVNGSSNSEATVVEAYSYVFEMRKLYNNTNGAKGAFVVSTNSSFGVDFGLPADYPIWCAMYDSLGAVGILSAGATANSNTDVDADGDIPTACSSDWLITVTNTTNTDQKNASAGYGLNTIDLGAPGTSVYSCLPGNTYGNLTGTSMATPQVAGAVALVYAAACSTFIQDYKNNPATYAMQVKNFIMEGVDTLPNLVASLHSGGRLNVFNSALKMVDFCSNGCYAPFGYAATQMTDSSGVITWADVAASDTFHIRWRPLGDTTWNYGTSMVPEYEIQGLSGCRPYEFEVESVCSGTPGGWSNTFVFYSEGCCVEPSGLSIVSADDTSAMVSWNGVYAATQYLLQYRPVGSPSWTDIIVSGDTLQITGLQNCTSYEWRIGSDCDTATSAYSSVMQFQTSGCGVCTDAPYCTGTGDPTFEWIESITIGPLQNASGNDNGYGDFTGAPLPFVSGTTMNVELVPGYSFFSFPDYWKIFLDVNADGDFDDAGEEIYSSGGTATGTVTGTAVIPAVVTPGISRLRVMQRFNTAPSPCDDQQFGEIEDYCVDLLLAASEELTTIPARAFPNPADGQLMIELPERGAYKIEILSLAGVTLLKTDASQAGITTLDVSGLSSGFYFVNIADQFSQTTLSFVKN